MHSLQGNCTLPNLLGVLDAIAAGAPQAGIPGDDTTATVHDIRAYYEEAALELLDGPPPGVRQAETWFYESTEAGRAVRAAEHAMKAPALRSQSGSTWGRVTPERCGDDCI